MDIVSTRAVAEMLGVSEATVKRWADAGTLKCFRTAGGHRKFRVRDVKVFLADGGEEVGIAVPPLRDLSSEQTEARALALAGDVDALVSLVATERLKGSSLAAVFDGMLTPALDEVSDAWAAGKLTPVQRRGATTAIIATLVRVRPLVERLRHKERGTALCAGMGDEANQDVALRMAALVLSSEGYHPVVAGDNVPSSELAMMVGSQTPTLVALVASATTRPGNADRLKGDLAVVASAAAAARAQVVLGGAGFAGMMGTPAHVKYFGTLEELAALTRFDAAPLQP